jgi:predicted Zn-dependent peptidase
MRRQPFTSRRVLGAFALGAAMAAAITASSTAIGARQKQQPPAPGPAKDFVIPTPKRFTLANGLPVTMVPFGQVPKVTIRLIVNAGNVYEGKEQVWLADLTGNMMREGTTALTGEALAREFAAMGGQLNVGVGPDTASISTDVLSDRGAQAAQLIADVAARPRLPESELARVKANMGRDLAIQKSTPQSVAQEKFSELLYGDHPYGRLFPTEAMLAGYTMDQVKAYHRDHFSAARARLYVAGVFDAAQMEAAVRKAFEGWAKGDTGAAPPSPAAKSGGFALLDRADAPQSTVMLGLKVPDPAQPDFIALEVTDALLGGSFGSRITSNIREQKGYTYSPNSVLQTHPGQAHWVEVADVTTKVTGASIKEIFFEIDRLRKEAPPATELQGIKNNLAGVFVVQNASRAGVIGQLAYVDQHRLGDQYLATYVKKIMAVTPEDVRRIATQYLTPDKMTLVVVGDTKTVKEQVAEWSKR